MSQRKSEPDPVTPALTASGLVRHFGRVKAVDGVDMKVRRGEIYGLIGPDGAGKTTLMRLLIGALSPDAGSIEVEKVNVLTDPDRARERIGYMPQQYGLYGDLTTEENLIFYGRLQGMETKRRDQRIAELLEFVRLAPFKDRRAQNLSGGMYKKLAIACSILHEPGLLLLDEPTNGVDPVSRRELWALLFRLASEGVAILVSTPYMDEAERCQQVGLMFQGRIRREGVPENLVKTSIEELFLEIQAAHPTESQTSGT